MMTAGSHRDRDLEQVIAGAHGAAAGLVAARGNTGGDLRSPRVGSEHLLLAALGRDGSVQRVLARHGVTRTTVLSVLRRAHGPGGGWTHDDGGLAPLDDPGTGAVVATRARRRWFGRARPPVPVRLTPAARRALREARRAAASAGMAQVAREHLLVALLADPDSRAADTLGALGVDRAAVHRSALAALHGDRTEAPVADDADLDVRWTRGVLLGQLTYSATSPTQRVLLQLLRALNVNWAQMPELWALLDAREHARRQSQRTVGTDHLLLGVLATHEVAHAHPHLLADDAPHRYRGGRLLAEFGVSHRRVKQAQAAALGPAARRAGVDDAGADALRALGIDVDEILADVERAFGPGALAAGGGAQRTRLAGDGARAWREAGSGMAIADGTGELVATLLAHEESAAHGLLRSLGVDVTRLRQQLTVTGGP